MVMVFWALDSFAGDWNVTANPTTERRNLGQKGNSESQLGARVKDVIALLRPVTPDRGLTAGGSERRRWLGVPR